MLIPYQSCCYDRHSCFCMHIQSCVHVHIYYKAFLFADTAIPTSPTTPVPSTPTISTFSFPTPTSITLSWEQPAGDAVDRYDIVYTYQGGCSDYTQPENMATVNDGTAREYTLQNLQEFSDYTISVVAVNSAGSSPAATAMATTAPSGT